ncbi:MOSC domain-containing protein [Francisella sp. SYW-9]|uniref:MOSC domain-containing protein n=1 Tax=Francisella sp. SYW-9 TaxID=2610888 RepID=UPI00123C8805|nr:MOSC domain-containing protein [Francisella sp. SYW-9]
MELVNICVGKTRIQNINGESVRTAYIKEPINGPIAVEKNGLANNEVAEHADAIYAFAEENYQYWADQLNVSSKKFTPGFFAENLIISQLDEKNLYVGDVIAIGEQVKLSVSGPRIPCFKLCWRLDQPNSFIQKFGLSGRSGVYFNVLQPGKIQAGDKVKVIHKERNSIAITEIASIALGQQMFDEEKLKLILALPGLSGTSSLLLGNRLYTLIDQKRLGKYSWENWRTLIVDQIIEETPNIKSFILKAIDNEPLALYRAGQFLTVKLPIENNDRSSLIRVWSLSDYHDQVESYRLSIKREVKGVGSGFMHNQIQEGMPLEVQPPMGRFVLDRSGFKPILLIAGGIGITPILAMLKAHLSRAGKNPPIYFIHCCQNKVNHPFRDELDKLVNKYNISKLYAYSQPNSEDTLGVDYDIKGYLTIKDIKSIIDGCYILNGSKKMDMPLHEFDVYMCGPKIFQETLQKALIDGGGNPERIFQESFEINANTQEHSELESSQVVFTTSNKEVEWKASDNFTLLELAESAGLEPACSCRMGICETCKASLVEGSVYYEFSLPSKLEKNQVLLCRAKPKTKRVVIKEKY